jgi:hypothetical protein
MISFDTFWRHTSILAVYYYFYFILKHEGLEFDLGSRGVSETNFSLLFLLQRIRASLVDGVNLVVYMSI